MELLLFWIEANDFRLNVPGQAFMALQARKIVKKYIGDGAKMKASRGDLALCRHGDGLDS